MSYCDCLLVVADPGHECGYFRIFLNNGPIRIQDTGPIRNFVKGLKRNLTWAPMGTRWQRVSLFRLTRCLNSLAHIVNSTIRRVQRASYKIRPIS